MVLLQPKLHLRLSQRQILTPGLVQMVSVLALNKLELRDMITAEMVENPVLEELEDSVPLLDDAARQEEDRERIKPEENTVTAEEKKDPFEEIDFGSFFQEYLDPGYRSRSEMEEIERPSFENFLSKPTTLSDHLAWQLGALSVSPEVREAAETIIGNLSEDGYLIASDEELLGIAPPAAPEVDASIAESVVKEAAALGLATDLDEAELPLGTKRTPRCLPNGTRWTHLKSRLPAVPTEPPSHPRRKWSRLVRLPRRSRKRRPRKSRRSLCFSPVSKFMICMKRSSWCARWIRLESPAATCAIACSINCATTRRNWPRTRMETARPPHKF